MKFEMMCGMLSFLFFAPTLQSTSFDSKPPVEVAYVAEAGARTPVAVATKSKVATVPFYSQFKDISSPSWQKVGCGIASLAMVIDYYKEGAVSVNALLAQGIKAGAYDSNAGWSHQGLITVSKKYGMSGSTYDYSSSSKAAALAKLTASVANGPVIASVHYKLEPNNPIPHLIVVNGIKDGYVYYNDPAAKNGEKKIAVAKFQKAWKQRYIVVRPTSAVTA